MVSKKHSKKSGQTRKKVAKAENQVKAHKLDDEFLSNNSSNLAADNDFCCESDQFHDGDQTQLYGVEAMTLQAQASRGMDYCYNRESNLSGWSNACFLGEFEKVKQFLNATNSDIDMMELIERRESMMRFSGIFHVVLGARINPIENHISIAKYLIENGARVNAKDTAGMTPFHYCVSQFGNSCTLEIAKILLENGADINVSNRFGATPLFEPCITAKYDFVEFLVMNGCNPKHKDSHGVSCYAYAMMNPKIKEIFAKSNKKLAEKSKLASEGTVEMPLVNIVCSSCELESPSLKKCSGCLTVSYCSLDCQKLDWKTHKSICKTKQKENKQNELILVFHPIVHSPDQDKGMLSNEESVNSDFSYERAMIIKVQVCVLINV